MMAFLHSNSQFQIDFPPTEILDISQEISRDFAPHILPDLTESFLAGELSQQELLAISEEISRDYAPTLSSLMVDVDCPIKLSPVEIREISETLSMEYTPKAANDVSHLVLLPVDPDHLYVYWNLAEAQLEPVFNQDRPLTLRVFSSDDKNGVNRNEKSWFDMAIDSSQAQKKLPLPQKNAPINYSAVLGKRDPENNFAALTHSNVVYAPFKKLIANQTTALTTPTEQLSQFIITSGKTLLHTSNNASGQSNIEP